QELEQHEVARRPRKLPARRWLFCLRAAGADARARRLGACGRARRRRRRRVVTDSLPALVDAGDRRLVVPCHPIPFRPGRPASAAAVPPPPSGASTPLCVALAIAIAWFFG